MTAERVRPNQRIRLTWFHLHHICLRSDSYGHQHRREGGAKTQQWGANGHRRHFLVSSNLTARNWGVRHQSVLFFLLLIKFGTQRNLRRTWYPSVIWCIHPDTLGSLSLSGRTIGKGGLSLGGLGLQLRLVQMCHTLHFESLVVFLCILWNMSQLQMRSCRRIYDLIETCACRWFQTSFIFTCCFCRWSTLTMLLVEWLETSNYCMIV